jgi:hypothetical protein
VQSAPAAQIVGHAAAILLREALKVESLHPTGFRTNPAVFSDFLMGRKRK